MQTHTHTCKPNLTDSQTLGAKSHQSRLLSLLKSLKLRKHSDASFVDYEFKIIQNRLPSPFTVDAAADDFGLNAKCKRFFSPARSFLHQTQLQKSDTVWINPPFHDLPSWIRHYKAMKATDPSLSACFLIPQTTRNMTDADVMQMQNAQTSRLIQEYPPDAPLFQRYDGSILSVPWPVRIIYDPPATARSCPTLRHTRSDTDTENQTSSFMSFTALLAGSPSRTLLDTGATHNFLDDGIRRRLGLRLIPADFPLVTFADKSTAPILGKCTFRLKLGSLHTEVTALVLDNMSHAHDLILGKPFLNRHKALLDCSSNTATFRSAHSKHRRIVVTTNQTQGRTAANDADQMDLDPWENAELDPRCLTMHQVEVLPAKDTFKALQNGERFFIAYLSVRPSDAANAIPAVYAYAHGEVKPGPVPEKDMSEALS